MKWLLMRLDDKAFELRVDCVTASEAAKEAEDTAASREPHTTGEHPVTSFSRRGRGVADRGLEQDEAAESVAMRHDNAVSRSVEVVNVSAHRFGACEGQDVELQGHSVCQTLRWRRKRAQGCAERACSESYRELDSHMSGLLGHVASNHDRLCAIERQLAACCISWRWSGTTSSAD